MNFYKERGLYLVVILFLIWMIISSVWYICGIKGFCQNEKINISNVTNIVVDDFIANEAVIKNTKIIKTVIECPVYLKNEMKENYRKSISEVKKLQSFLNDFENENLIINGIYNLNTQEAVRRFQEKNSERIEVANGYVGAQTRNEINATVCIFEFNKKNFNNLIK